MPDIGYITVILRVQRDEETGQFTARCEDFGLSSCGDTLDEAFLNAQDAVEMYLSSLEEVGERARVFAERGITIRAFEDDNLRQTISALPHEYVSAQHMKVPAFA